jgi:hypothetical protein
MDYGDIVRLIVFGFIILSFLSGLFGKSDKEKKAEQRKAAQPRPARPTELAESGGQPRPRPPLVPAQPVLVDPAHATPIFVDAGEARIEERERSLLERDIREAEPIVPRERDFRARDMAAVERDYADMPTIAEDLDPESHPRARRRAQMARPPRYVEGGDVLRRSLKDPSTLERAFIVKEILDRPLALRDDR